MGVTVIFGGTFNPFHIGHYEMLRILNEQPEVEKVFLMPDRIPPHKVCDYMAPDEDRIEMCRIAADDFPKTEVSLVEFEREGKSYTYDTVTELKKRYPNTHFVLCCGGDMITSLNTWYNWQELIKEISFYAFGREGVNDFKNSVEYLTSLGAEIRVFYDRITDISSTELREKLRNGEKTSYIPPKINDYILKRKLYNE